MPPDDEPVERLQAKPYNPHARRGKQHAQARVQKGTAFFWQQQRGRRNPFLSYLLLFLLTALLATAIFFGFLVLLVLIAVLFPIWIVVRLWQNRGAP